VLGTPIRKDTKKEITELKWNTEVVLKDINKSINESTEKMRNTTEYITSIFN